MKTWIRRIIGFVKGTADEHIDAFAGQSTFFIFLSFFPLLNILLALAPILPFSEQQITELILKAMPADLSPYVRAIISDIYNGGAPSFTIFSILMAVWSAAKGIMAIRNGLNEVYRSRENKNFLVIRGISALYTLVFIAVLVVLTFANLFGRQLYANILEKHEEIRDIAQLIVRLRGVGSFLVIFFLLLGMYTFMPNRKLLLRYQCIGAIFAAGSWVLVSWGFSYYIEYALSKSKMYGSLTMIIMLLFWLYLMVSLIFWGAQINQFLYEYVYKERADRITERRFKRRAIRKAWAAEKVIRHRQEKGWRIPRRLAKKYPELVNPPKKEERADSSESSEKSEFSEKQKGESREFTEQEENPQDKDVIKTDNKNDDQ